MWGSTLAWRHPMHWGTTHWPLLEWWPTSCTEWRWPRWSHSTWMWRPSKRHSMRWPTMRLHMWRWHSWSHWTTKSASGGWKRTARRGSHATHVRRHCTTTELRSLTHVVVFFICWSERRITADNSCCTLHIIFGGFRNRLRRWMTRYWRGRHVEWWGWNSRPSRHQ